MKAIEIIFTALGFFLLFGLCINALVPMLTVLCIPAGIIVTAVMYARHS